MQSSHAGEPFRARDPDPGKGHARRAVEGATLVIVAATAVAVLASSWPLFASWLEPTQADAARPGIARAVRSRGWAVSTPRKPRPRFAPRAPTAKRPSASDTPGGFSHGGAIARPYTILQLFDEIGGKPKLTVNPEDKLIVMKEDAPWLLLAVKRDGEVLFGWTTYENVQITR